MRAGAIRIRQMEYGFLVCDRRSVYKHTPLISAVVTAVNINNIFVCHWDTLDVSGKQNVYISHTVHFILNKYICEALEAGGHGGNASSVRLWVFLLFFFAHVFNFSSGSCLSRRNGQGLDLASQPGRSSHAVPTGSGLSPV